jgi:hypothetical protein
MRIVTAMLVYFGVASLLAQSALVGVMWQKGLLSRGKLINMLAVAHNVDLPSVRRNLIPPDVDEPGEQFSMSQVTAARNLIHLNLDLREIGADKGWNEMRALQDHLIAERELYQKLKVAFDERLKQLQEAGADAALRDVQIRVESMNPKQAKEQILRILDDKDIGEDLALDQVVTMVKSMPAERRKKILGEFKSEDDAKRLHLILKRIRVGSSDVALIRETREKVKRFAPPPLR